MELENRYIVIKRTDLKYLCDELKFALDNVLATITYGRQLNGKPPLSGLHIESDWPEYESTKAALLARINGAAETLENIQAEELSRSRFNTEKRTPPGVESSGHSEVLKKPDGAPIKQWCSALRRDCERNCPTACLAVMEDMRIGGPGSIPQETLAAWDRDAKEQLESQTLRDTLAQKIELEKLLNDVSETFKVMMCSAGVYTDADDTVTAYKINTGAAHRMLTLLRRKCLNVFIPNNLPVVK